MSDEIRILLAEDHPLIREALRNAADKQPDFKIVAEVSDGEQAVKLAKELVPHVVVMDITMPKLDGLEATKQIKEINPFTEIIIYVYSPVPTEGSELYKKVTESGFKFPETLDDWLNPQWENFDLRKNPLTPWLTTEIVNKILDFETVINAQYPTISDFKLTSLQKSTMRVLSSLRYKTDFYRFPYELKALQKFWLKYRRPEVEGFYTE